MAGHASACLHVARLLARESLRASRSRLPHRFGQRVRPRVHVALLGCDARVTCQHPRLVARHAIICKARQRLVAQVVPVPVDPRQLLTLRPALRSTRSCRFAFRVRAEERMIIEGFGAESAADERRVHSLGTSVGVIAPLAAERQDVRRATDQPWPHRSPR
jgi:hypothetical protein